MKIEGGRYPKAAFTRPSLKKGTVGNDRQVRLRIYIFASLLACFFVFLFAKAFYFQVIEAEGLRRMAVRQQTRTVALQSKRGEIFDRNSKELAVSLEVDSVCAWPARVSSPRAAASALAHVLSMDRREIEKRLRSNSGFVWVKRQIDLNDEQRRLISTIEGVGTVKEDRRYYPNKALASNMVGFTNKDSKGIEGIELYYDKVLKGASRKFVGDVDGRGRVLMYEDPGKDGAGRGMEMELTIDKTMQFIAEKSLRKAVEDYGAKGGTALVMDPMTGEVLAMASLPTFDPNDRSGYKAGMGRNRAVADVMEPGSTLKLFLIAAALEEKALRPSDGIYCENGSYKVDDRTFHDTERHGWLTVSQILKLSSNIGASKIGERLGKAKLYRYLQQFGFGERTGLDVPGETTGALRDFKRWNNVALHTVSFGQGVSVTSIQLITALSAVANGGLLMKPYAVHTIKDPSGAAVTENNPAVVRRVISQETAARMTDMLIGVTGQGGTGVKAAIPGFEVAGKTGTAQKPDLKDGGYVDGAYVSSFFGFVPARSPRLAILVTIDEPRKEYYAATVAAPAWKSIAEEGLSYLGVYPEGRSLPMVQFASLEGADAGDAGAALNVMDAVSGNAQPPSVPDFTGATVRTALRLANQRAIDVEIRGSGMAVAQKPPPGQGLGAGGGVMVWFQ
ncbi:MAG: penicillin-binding protein [Deltaproteobacteria bacterium]|nr:penicillin-binding protein [Deltaproteobacteria bacterium]